MSFVKDLLNRLATLPAEEHEAAIAEALAEAKATPAEMSGEITDLFSELYGDGESLTSEAVDQLEILGRLADGVDNALQEAAARAARAQEIGQRIENLKRDAATTEEASSAPGDDGSRAAPDDEPEIESGPAEPTEAEEEPQGAEDEEEEEAERPKPASAPAKADVPPSAVTPRAPAPELVAASVNDARIPLGQMPSSQLPDAPQSETFESFSLIAAADVPGFATGQAMESGLGDFARAWEGRMFPMIAGGVNSGKDGERTRVGIARIRRQLPEAFTIRDEREADQKIKDACDETRLPGGSLTASAGWCAPSETLYDLCPIRMTQEGLISLPQLQTKRGGLRFPADFDWAAVWSSIGFELTEEEVIAGTEKRCVEVPCPTEWQECRMDVTGLCIRTPILMERGWPERIEQFMEGALLVHAHKQNARKLAKMEALSHKVVLPGPRPGVNDGDPVIDAHGPGATESLLSILELQVQYQRYRHRLSQSGTAGTLEMIAPYWIRGVLKSDLRKKLGIDNRWNISDAQVDGYLRNVGVNPQYVYDWQDAFEHPMSPSGFGGPIPVKWPERVKIMLYPAGAFFELSDEVINLDGVYDHASLIQNVYTGLFTEEGWAVCKRCLDSYVVEFDMCANGLSGTHIAVSCDELPKADGKATVACAS